MTDLFIPVLLGTAREERQSEKAARFVVSELEKRDGVETELVDVRDMGYAATVPPWGKGGTENTATDWQKTMTRADGLIIVVPEYNHGYPGELKLALDSLYDEYEKKPVALCGVSSGGWGGTRVVDLIKPTLVELKMVPMRNAMYCPNIKDAFAEDGSPTDPKATERLEKVFIDLLWYARVLKSGRESSE